ncbi:MAG: phosphoribosylaminoimidazolesuccinocarboxamide synthase [Bacteroidota bacterium]|nr:phosphoribosylaminoimidazolesuccinocarboxamide synthase [Candidatus Kapabacteria bacterium]MDW8220564.1 phosphoribosylaminoimidazolesuccinocarboxamide synthase [Bacteroidota bacterium]
MMYSDIPTLSLLRRGKVRDIYDLGRELLIVACDRISAFDIVMEQPIPDKGTILTTLSLFWFEKTRHIIDNHVVSACTENYPSECYAYREELAGRSMLVRKTTPLAIECVVRGYLAGSGWKEYMRSGTICGIRVPAGLQESDQLPEPLFTPATKATTGHDENISFEQAAHIVGKQNAQRVRDISLDLYRFAAGYALERGIIIADTKFEFGIDAEGKLILIDEVLTPDSSRFWLASEWKPGTSPRNFDKQVLRDYLETLDWNKQYPPPPLPQHIIDATAAKYREALTRLTAQPRI